MVLTTNIVSNKELKDIMEETLKFLSDTLSNTLGPYGSTTIIQDRMMKHEITKDGYSLLKRIFIEEEEARTITDFVKKISRNLVRKVGDGSTSSIIIAYSLYTSLTKVINKYNMPAKDLLVLLEALSNIIADSIKHMARPISDDISELVHIASVSTNNDLSYGKLITEIFQKIGRYGFINLEKSKTEATTYEITNGFELPRGWIIPDMVNQNDEKTCEFDNPAIFMCDEAITEEDLPFIAQLAGDICGSQGRPLVFVAKDFDNAASTFFFMNITRNKIPMLAVPLAMSSKDNKARFKDLAINLGAKPYEKSKREPLNPETFSQDRLGSCNKIISTDTFTRFVEGHGDEELINERIAMITEKIEELSRNETIMDNDPEIFSLRKRMSHLSNSMAVLYVGGKTEDAKESDKFLVEDAVFACRSALEHGYIAGGNLITPIILKDEKIRGFIKETLSSVDEEILEDVITAIYDAFVESFTCVLNNCYKDYDKSLALTKECVEKGAIFNLKQNRMESINETNIINSAETDIEIMKSAISLIGLLVTSNQFIAVNSKRR